MFGIQQEEWLLELIGDVYKRQNIYTATGGFQIVGTGAGINASGGTYIYLAIA